MVWSFVYLALRRSLEPVSADAVCRFMKMITPDKLLVGLREAVHEVEVPEPIRVRAVQAVRRMIALGQPGGGE